MVTFTVPNTTGSRYLLEIDFINWKPCFKYARRENSTTKNVLQQQCIKTANGRRTNL